MNSNTKHSTISTFSLTYLQRNFTEDIHMFTNHKSSFSYLMTNKFKYENNKYKLKTQNTKTKHRQTKANKNIQQIHMHAHEHTQEHIVAPTEVGVCVRVDTYL